MEKFLYLFSGRVRVEIACLYPERFMNICARNGIAFTDLEYTDDSTILVTVSLSDYKKLKRLIGRSFSMRSVRKWGTPFLFYGIRKRYVLIAGMTACFFAVLIMSMFIWQIDVTGNKTVPTERILTELDDLGVSMGTCSFAFSQDYISNEILQRIPELCWIAVNVKGSRAEVKVRETVPPPDMIDSDTPTIVYAEKGGLITDIAVYNGQTECSVGQTVSKGDVLATGIMDNKLGGHRIVHAMARVTARTWYNISAVTPAERCEKVYTGGTKTKTSIIIADKRINLYFNSGISWQNYDKITERKNLTLFGGAVLPICIEKTSFREYELQKKSYDLSAGAEEYLRSALKKQITDGEIQSEVFEHEESGGVLRSTLRAECSEQIAVMRDLTEDEISSAEKNFTD